MRSDRLFDSVVARHLNDRPVALRHPLAFYAGHLPAFASNMLVTGLLGETPRDRGHDDLFAFGIDPDEESADWTHGDSTDLRLPAFEAITDYRDTVRDQLRDCAERIVSSSRDGVSGDEMLLLVVEHEVMHHETLTYLLQELPTDAVVPGLLGEATTGAAERAPAIVEIGAGEVSLGADRGDHDFVHDNELGRHDVAVDRFWLSDLPVTIGDYLEFVAAGGYDDRRHWSEHGWRWRERHDIRHPKDWRQASTGYLVRSMFAEHEIETVTGWPVCVSWAEADAYARWKGGRLPTEAELHRAAYTSPDPAEQRTYPWGDPPASEAAYDFGVSSPVPVGAMPDTDSAWGVGELVGNGWEWTSTAFAPYPGFRAYVDTYAGYSTDFFDGKHMVVFGASWATDRRLLRPSFRNWYRYNYPYPFTKFRVAYDQRLS